MERPKFLPKGITIGRTAISAIEKAHSELPISARVYMALEDDLAKNPNREETEIAQKILWRVIRQPKVLKSMTEFIAERDKLIRKS